MTLLLIAWAGLLVYMSKRYEQDAQISAPFPPVPSTFLELKKDRRNKALNLYWKFGYKQLVSQPISSAVKTASNVFLFFLFIGSALSIVLVHIINIDNHKHMNVLWGFPSLGLIIFYLVLMIFGTGFFNSFLKAQSDQRRAQALEEADKSHNQLLQKLAAKFIETNYNEWVEKMLNVTQNESISLLDLKDVKTFVLKSSKFAINYTTRSVPVPPRLMVSFIFSNGFVSTVSGIVLDVRETSFGYKNSDDLILCYSDKDEFETDEFHYRDIVEIKYEPASTTAKTDYSYNTEIPIEGYLIFGLVNGSQKKYPSTKASVSEFINLSREKVREIKKF